MRDAGLGGIAAGSGEWGRQGGAAKDITISATHDGIRINGRADRGESGISQANNVTGHFKAIDELMSVLRDR